MNDFLFLNIYICYINSIIITYFLSNSGHPTIRYPAMAFWGSTATHCYPQLTAMILISQFWQELSKLSGTRYCGG